KGQTFAPTSCAPAARRWMNESAPPPRTLCLGLPLALRQRSSHPSRWSRWRLNPIQGIYERDIALTFTITFQHTWTTADPFGGADAVAILNAFTNYWNANFAATQRDVAHLWSGKNLNGPNGLAWTGVVCLDGAHSYGISDRETIAPFRVTIPAHEIGHNFNASHCDAQAGCTNTIMVATQNQSNTSTFCAFSVNEITNFVNAN